MDVENFTGKAAAYAKGRPGYPKAAVDVICELAPEGCVFADIGAGTGKFAENLVKRGYMVYAVEPNADMRSQLSLTLNLYQNSKILAGDAKNTTLPDHSVDIITVAHALHWFDPEEFWNECHRILRKDGIVIAIFNHEPGKENTDFCKKAVDAFFHQPKTWFFQNPIEYTRERWIAYILSQDDVPLASDPEYPEFLKSLNTAFDRESVEGILHCDRLTGVYAERI